MKRIPASEVVRSTELVLQRAANLRIEAKRILEEAVGIETSARAAAIAVMGDIRGSSAYEMALWSVSENSVTDVVVPDLAAPETPSGQAEPAEHASTNVDNEPSEAATSVVIAEIKPAAPLAAAVPPVQKSPSKPTELFGVEIPPSRILEAEEIVETVRSYLSQGRKSNPHANDRGKNAWRKSLFNSAWQDLASVLEKASFQSAVVAVVQEQDEPAETPHVVELPAAVSLETVDNDVSSILADELSDITSEEEAHISEVLDQYTEVPEDLDWERTDVSGSIEPEPEPEVEDSFYGADTVSAEADHDPLDDLDLPPAIPVRTPPRGYPVKPAVPTPAAPEPTVAESEHIPPSSDEVPPAPSRLPPVPPRLGTPAIHTPQPVPVTRRPGTGQALQSPPTLPSVMRPGAVPPPRGAHTLQSAPPPPAFMNRR